jgi:long-chain fatty acid transport protein
MVRRGCRLLRVAFPPLALLLAALSGQAQGLVLTSVGPVNRSMGGASVAAPLDAAGALYWNPATLSGLPRSEIDFGLELLYTTSYLSSEVAPGAFGPGTPPVPLAGSTRGDGGVFPLPSFGFAYRPEESPWSFGVGVFGVGGFGSNYPGSFTNPILTAQPPNGFGLGPIASQLLILQVAPVAAYQVTDRLSVAFGPALDLATLTLDPAPFAAPDDANGDGFRTFPPANHSRVHWGAGFQAGAYYTLDNGLRFGAAVKSPQWFETFHFQSHDELGRPRTVKLRFDYPLIASIGAAYSGIEKWLFAVDVRYVDYANTKGFGPAGFDATGAGTGLGWRSVVSVASGVQYQLTPDVAVRMGYTFNPNPIPDANSVFNVASAPLYEHVLYMGASFRMTEAWTLSASYFHAFENSITGPYVTPAGAVPGTSVTTRDSTDGLTAGVSVQF